MRTLANKLFRPTAIFTIAISSTLVYGKPVILACDMQFVGCVKELDGRKVCAPQRPQKNTIELDGSSIRHLDDYGYLQHKNCDVSETLISCAEDPEAPGLSGSLRSTRRLTIERTTGRIDASIDTDLVAQNGASLKHKGWLNTYTGYCSVRENKNVF